jgi:hypothetical protein
MVLSPGGYTALPMRVPTTRMIFFIMARTIEANGAASQRACSGPDLPATGVINSQNNHR